MVNRIVLVTWRRRRRYCTKSLAVTSTLMSLILIIMTQILNSSRLVVDSEAIDFATRMKDDVNGRNDTQVLYPSFIF